MRRPMALLAMVLVVTTGANAALAQIDESYGEDGALIIDEAQTLVVFDAVMLVDGGLAIAGAAGDHDRPEEEWSPWLGLVSPDGAGYTSVDLSQLPDDLTTIEAVAQLGARLIVVARSALGADPCVTTVALLGLDGAVDPEFGEAGFVTLELCGLQAAAIEGDEIQLLGGTEDFESFSSVVSIARDGSTVETSPAIFGLSLTHWLVDETGRLVVVEFVSTGAGQSIRTGRTDGSRISSATVGQSSGAFVPFPTGRGLYGYLNVQATRVLPYLVDRSGEIEVFQEMVVESPSTSTEVMATALERNGRVALFTGATGPVRIDLLDSAGTPVELVGDTADFGPFTFPSAAFFDDTDGSVLLVADTQGPVPPPSGDVLIARYLLDDSGRFTDDDNSVHESAIETIARSDITRGCNPPLETEYCPDDSVTRAQMASFLARALGLEPADDTPFTDTDGTVHAANIAALAQAGITTGCAPDRYCPDDPVTRAQMASFLVRAFELEPADHTPFTDTDGSVHAANIAALARAGITFGCTATEYCPDEPVTRAQMASFLVRALARGN